MSGDRYFISDQHATYFLTFTVTGWVDVFTRRQYKDIIVQSMNYCIEHKGLKVYAWCLMSNHLHMISSIEAPWTMSGFIRDFKKYTAKEILSGIQHESESRREWMLRFFKFEGSKDKRISNYKFWKEDNHAVFLDQSDHFMFEQKIDYIHANPVEDGTVEKEEEYLYSSARDYYGTIGLVKIERS